jgi:hypothetical protein
MKKIVYVLAILAAASTGAVAKDLKQDNKAAAPAVSATQMNDAEMDRVTAGAPSFSPGRGIGTAQENPGHGSAIGRPDFVSGAPGSGRCIRHGCS